MNRHPACRMPVRSGTSPRLTSEDFALSGMCAGVQWARSHGDILEMIVITIMDREPWRADDNTLRRSIRR
jgi:hypothetical protein